MNPLARLFTRQSKKKSVKAGNVRELGRHLDTFPTLLSDHDVYENVYASVRPIVSYFTDLEPYAKNIKGEKIESPAVDAIYRPNDKFDFTSFMDAVAVGVLTGSEVNILVWRKEGRKIYPGGKLTKDNIAGYTFITKWTTDVYGNRVYERTTESGIETFTDKEVMTLVHSRNPHNLSKGYSPAHAARRWTNIDDLMADYQSGHFNNNAVGSGMFLVAAPSSTEYEDLVRRMKEHHQGAGKNNGVIYSHVPTDPNTGKSEQSTITWVPFNVSNKDLELGTLFDNTNKKIDSAFAVPAVMRGVDSNSTYANASVSKREFMEGVIRPFAKKIYSQWTHELNRITGGIEAVIKVDVEIPEVADEKKVQEETLAIRDNRIRQYIDLGYSLESIKRYLDTNDITALEKEIVPETEPNETEPDTELATQSEDNTTVIYAPKAIKQISSRDYPELLDGTDIDTDNLGCIMIDTEKLEVLSVVGDDASDDLIEAVDRHDHTMGAVAEVEPHVTLLYGLLENGNLWKDKVDTLLDGWEIDTVKIEDVSYFNLPESYAIIAHVKKTTDLLDGHDRLTLLPHINTFSTYKPHMTLAYIKKEADLGKWLTTLNEEYAGKEIKVSGINYGDLPNKEAAKSTNPKATKELTLEQEADYQLQLEVPTRNLMQAQVDRAVSEIGKSVKEVGDPTEEDREEWIDEMMIVIASILLVSGALQWALGRDELANEGIVLPAVYELSEGATSRYRTYLNTVFDSYSKDTAEHIRTVLDNAAANGFTRAETEAAVRSIMDTDAWRVERIGRTEVARSNGLASVESMQKIQEDAGVRIYKRIQHEANACSFCIAASEQMGWTPVDEAFYPKGATITDAEGAIFVNDWTDLQSATLHANCRCVTIFEVREA